MSFKSLISKIRDIIVSGISKLISAADKKIDEHNGKSSDSSDSDESDSKQEKTEDAKKENTDTEHDEYADSVPYSMLKFNYGGFSGSSASLDTSALIRDLKVNVSGSKMTYSWVNKMSGLWGNGYSDAEELACMFIPDGSSWTGGKFDWISPSRTSRDFKNIFDGYNGWNASKFKSAKKFAFVIVSKDGKKRTNVILAEN